MESEYKHLDEIIEFVERNGLKIEPINKIELEKEIRNDIISIKKKYDNSIELEERLNNLEESTRKTRDRYYVGSYHDSYARSKELHDYLKHVQLFYQIEVPSSFKSMIFNEYETNAWGDLFFTIIYQMANGTVLPINYKKDLQRFFSLNKRASRSYIARMRNKLIKEYLLEMNSDHKAIDYREFWKSDSMSQKLSLYNSYQKYMSKGKTSEEAIKKIFEDLKNKFGLSDISDTEAGMEIKSITGITFYSKTEGVTYSSTARTILGYSRYQ